MAAAPVALNATPDTSVNTRRIGIKLKESALHGISTDTTPYERNTTTIGRDRWSAGVEVGNSWAGVIPPVIVPSRAIY